MREVTLKSFGYRGQSQHGQPVSGTIEASSHDEAMHLLAALGVRVTEVEQAKGASRPRRAGLGATEFQTFNQQLAHLTQAGLPVERGLRLIAQEATSGRFARAVQQVADDVERGQPLGEAFGSRRSAFPPLYGQLVDAGVAANDLPGMLFNLNRHIEMVQRLRGAVRQAVAYPLIVAIALSLVLLLISVAVLPPYREVFRDFGMDLPTLTRWTMSMTTWGPIVFGGLLVVLVAIPLLLRGLRLFGIDAYVTDGVCLPLPLIGPVVRKSLVARWCDAVRVGVEAGIDLPAAMNLASDAIASPGLRNDTTRLAQAIESGQRMGTVPRLNVLARTVPAAMELGIEQGTLAETLGTLARMYREQAETRVRMVHVILTPLLLLVVATVVGLVVAGLLLPLARVTRMVM